jgi:hypothetical protein
MAVSTWASIHEKLYLTENSVVVSISFSALIDIFTDVVVIGR